MFADLNDKILQPQRISNEVSEIVLSEEIRNKLQGVLETEETFARVDASTSVVKPDNNNVFFSNQWYYIAVVCKKFAKALYPYCSFFDEKIRNNTEITNGLAAGKTDIPSFVSLFNSDDDRIRMIKFIQGDPEFRPGKALINKREGNRVTIRSCKDIFGSCVLKKVAVPDSSSNYLGNLIYYLAKNADVYDALEIEINEFLKRPVVSNMKEEPVNEYERAAAILNKHLETMDTSLLTEKVDVEKARDIFLKHFAPEKLAAIPDDQLLTSLFYSQAHNTESLSCWIETNKECKKYFGSISGGSAYKFGLFQRQDNGKWVTGLPMKSKELTYEEALLLGKRIRDALVKGSDIIRNTQLETVDDYEKLDDKLRAEISSESVYYDWVWFHKYYSILFPDKFSSYHQNLWQKHILWALRIKPSEKMYARSGQISMVQRVNGWWYRQLMDIVADRFGGVKQFLRLGSSDGTKGYASEWKKNSVVAIGWPGVGSLEEYKNEDGSLNKDDISAKLQEEYYPNNGSTASRKAGELIRFYESNNDSVFLIADGEKIIGFVDKLGGYQFDDSSEMPHIKSGLWHTPFGENEKLPEKTEGLLTSCIQIKNEENLMFLYEKYFYGEKQDKNILSDKKENEKSMKTCLEIERQPRRDSKIPLNLIVYGAPGTGKTYGTVENALKILEIPIPDNRKDVMKKYKEMIQEGRIVFTTFHQNYGYEEFIQGLRPDTKSDKMAFKIVDGVFKRIADKALNDTEGNNYVIIIDEINRANISKVFGELITLIEEDKRWGEIDELSVTLQSGDSFAVPNNLYIIGTMNTADKSISLIDAALRRRFSFEERKPDSTLVPAGVLRKMFEEINRILVDQLDSTDLLIGHSYFMNKKESDLCRVLNNSIIPLVYEYFYDDKKKVISLLNSAIEKSGASIEIIDEKVGRIKVRDKIE